MLPGEDAVEQGAPVDRGAADDGRPAKLHPGAYAVYWRMVALIEEHPDREAEVFLTAQAAVATLEARIKAQQRQTARRRGLRLVRGRQA